MPIASSAMNRLNVRLNVSTHSPKPSRAGELGTAPVRGSVVAVDKREAAEPRLARSFAAAACEQPHRRTDSAAEEEPCPERTGRHERQLRAELARDVRRLADA